MNIKPLADRVLIEPAPAEEKTIGGIIIPDTAKEKPLKGEVIAVGNGTKDEEMVLKVGDTNSKIGLSSKHKIISKSMNEAVEAVDIGSKLYKNEFFYDYKKVKVFSYLDNFLDEEEWKIIKNKILEENMGEELLETFISYMKHSGERKKTAESLHIHRNTLNYRLERIEEITGLSFDNYLDLFQFLIAYIVSQLK